MRTRFLGNMRDGLNLTAFGDTRQHQDDLKGVDRGPQRRIQLAWECP